MELQGQSRSNLLLGKRTAVLEVLVGQSIMVASLDRARSTLIDTRHMRMWIEYPLPARTMRQLVCGRAKQLACRGGQILPLTAMGAKQRLMLDS
jgi:hypothetical protein